MGIGQVWGTAEELLHPRDRHGRFRKKWKMATGVAKKILGFLDGFSPRMFQNDAQAAQYVFNTPHTRFEAHDLTRLRMDFDQSNEHLRSGDMDPSTKQFVSMMDRHKVALRDDVILTRTVGPEAFGLTPQQMTAEDGGLEDFTGKLLADRGYGATHIGGIVGGQQPGAGKITMRIATPKGTQVIIPASHHDDRGVILDRDQELRITKVQPDGAGGYYVLAVATPRTKGETPTPVSTSPRGVELTPDQREARITERATGYAHPPSEHAEVKAANERIATAGEAQRKLDEAKALEQAQISARSQAPDIRDRRLEPQEPAPQTTEQLPQGVEPRNEPVQAPGAPAAPEATPAAPRLTTPDEFRAAVRDIKAPSAGPRRKEWNNAYLDVLSGKKHPEDALRELERDIEVNKASADRPESANDVHLRDDIKSQERLADAIRERYNLGQNQAPEGAAPAPHAPSAPEAAPVKKAVTRAKKAVSSEGGTNAAGLTPDQRQAVANRVDRMKQEGKFNPDNPEHQRLQGLVDQMGPAKKAAPKAAVKKAAPAKVVPEPAPVNPVGRRQLEILRRASESSGGRLDIHPDDLHNEDVAGLRERGFIRTRASRDGAEVTLTQAGRKHLTNLDRQGTMKKAAPAAKVTAPEAPAVKKAAAGPIERLRPREVKVGDTIARQGATLVSARHAEGLPTAKVARIERNGSGYEFLDAGGQRIAFINANSFAHRRERGVEVPGVAPAEAAKKAAPEVPGERPLEKNTVKELRDIAGAEGVELRSKMLKADIVKEIQRSRSSKGAPKPAAGEERVSTQDELRLLRREAEGQREAGHLDEARRLDAQADRLLPAVKKTAPAKKAAKAAVAKVPTERPLEKNTISELRKMALDENVTLPKKALKKDIVKAIQDSRDLRGAAETRAAKKAVPSVPHPAEVAANTRQADINEARKAADAATEIDELINNGVDDAVMTRAINRLADAGSIGPDERQRWLGAVGDNEKLARQVDEFAHGKGLQPLGRAGEVVAHEPSLHQGEGGIRRGDAAETLRRGYLFRRGSEDIRLSKPTTAPIRPPDTSGPITSAKAEKLVPQGSVPGPKAQVPIASTERKASFKDAWESADIKAKGSAGRSLTEIRDDVASGKITPEEGVRRLESEISLNKAELSDMEATLRGDMKPADRRELIPKSDDLEDAIAAQEKASHLMRDHFKDEPAITAKEIQVELPAGTLDRVKPEDLKDEAVRQGLDRPSGNTTEEVIQDIAKKMAQQELDRRATEAVKKAAPAKKAAPPTLPKEKGKLDARILAEGLDLEGHHLDALQSELDSGKKTPAAIGRDLTHTAEAVRTHGVLRHTRHLSELEQTPTAKARDEHELAKARKTADQLDELAKRLQATRRPSVKAAPAKKVAPAVKAAEARADSAEHRLAQNALERLQAAKNETQVREALSGLTFKEMKELAEQHGITAPNFRSKEGITQGFIGRYTGKPADYGVPGARPSRPAAPEAPSPTKATSKFPAGQNSWSGHDGRDVTDEEERDFLSYPLTKQAQIQQRLWGPREGTSMRTTFFGSHPDSSVKVSPEREAEIRRAVEAIAPSTGGGWMTLQDVREKLGSRFSRAEVDDVLLRLNRSGDWHVVPEANQKVLSPRQRLAAVVIGNQDKHAVRIVRTATGGAVTKAAPAVKVTPSAPTPSANLRQIEQDLKAQGRVGTGLRQSSGIRDEAARALRNGEDPKMVARRIRDRIPEIRQATPEDSSGRVHVTQADMGDLKRADIGYLKALADAIEKGVTNV